MKAKKRYVVGFWIATSLVVALAIGMVAVIAAFTTTTTSSFSVDYTAVNVNAKITAKYDTFTVDGDSYANSAANFNTSGKTFSETIGSVTFNDNNTTEEADGNLGTVNKFSITKDEIVVIQYVIENTSTSTPINLDYGDDSNTTGSNVIVRYSTDGKTWKTDTSSIPSTIAADTSCTIYVSVAISNRTEPAGLNATKTTIGLSVA